MSDIPPSATNEAIYARMKAESAARIAGKTPIIKTPIMKQPASTSGSFSLRQQSFPGMSRSPLSATGRAGQPSMKGIVNRGTARSGAEVFLIEFDKRTHVMLDLMKYGPPIYAREFKALLSLAAYQDIIPEIQVRTPTRKWSRKAPKLRFSVYASPTLEGTTIYQGGGARRNYIPWWTFIIEKGSVPHRLGPGGVGGGKHPGFAPKFMFKRGLEAGIPRYINTLQTSLAEFMRWVGGNPTHTGRFTNEVGVQMAVRRATDRRWKHARRMSVAARRASARAKQSKSGLTRSQAMLPGFERVGSDI